MKCDKKSEFFGICPIVKKIDQNEIFQYGLAFPIFINFGG